MKLQLLPCVAFLLSTPTLLLAQTSSSAVPTRPDRGFYPNGSFSPSEFDTVNNVTGNVIARVPITSFAPNRGGAQFGVNLIYNSAIYDTRSATGTVSPSGLLYGYQALQKSEYGGWQLGYQYGLEYETRPAGPSCSAASPESFRVHKMYLRTPDGSLHTLRLHALADVAGDGFFGVGPNKEKLCVGNGNDDAAPPGAGDLVYTTTDGTYIRVEIGYSFTLAGCSIAANSPDYWTCRLWRAFLPDGTEIRGHGKRVLTMIDRNGNEVYLSSYVSQTGNTVDLLEDQAGRFIEIEKFVSPRKDVVRRLGFGQQLLEWEIQYQTIEAISNVYYQCANNVPTPYPFCVTSSFNSHEVVSKVKFPSQTVNGANYVFDFDYAVAAQNGWGELRNAYFPSRAGPANSRARLEFAYRWDNYTTTTAAQTPMRDVTQRLENPVTKRTLSYTGGDGIARSEIWDYAFTDTSSTITLPDGSTQTASFDLTNPWRWDRGLVHAETMPLGRSVTRTWQRNPPLAPIAAQAAANAYVSSETISLGTRAGQAKTTTRSITVDRNGNQTLVVESDWLANPLRRSQRIYLYPTTVANGAAPTVDNEVNAYWRPGPRRSLRALKRQRTIQDVPTTTTRSMTEFTHDANWNVTQSRQWDSTKLADAPAESAGDILHSGNAVIQQSSFTPTGNATAAFDANLNQSTFAYGQISGCSPTQPTVSDLYPTSKIEGANNSTIQRSFTLAYDCNTGVVTSETDINNAVTTTRSYDAFGRPVLATAPDGSRTEWAYQDGNYRTAEYRDVATAGDKLNATVRHFDDLGRLFLQQTTAEQNLPGSNALPALADATPVNGILVEHLYAAPCRTPSASCDNFRYEAVSNPYRVAGTDPRGWTRTKTDALGRPVEIQYFTGDAKPFPWSSNSTSTGTETIAYDADQTTTTDPAGRKRTSEVDGFGRLIRVVEDASAGGFNYPTLYQYDVLDNLTKVTQGSRIRDFEYTSLSRLKSTTQPETGQISYVYDNNGNLLTKSDARGSLNIGGYDALNRILSKSWTVANTPAVQFTYDACPYGKGRLCSVTASGVGGSSFEYDTLGRPVKKTQTIGGTPYVMQQGYLLSGAVSWMTYPTGTVALPRKVSHEYWPNGQLKAVWQGDVGTGSRYATVNSYHAAGHEKNVVLGNLLQEDTTLNPRLQIAGRTVTFAGPPAQTLWSTGYDYGAVNDGNLKLQTISGSHAGQAFSFTQNYSYDNLSRIRTVKDSGLACGPDGNTNQKFVYDRYGNKANLASASTCGESSGAAVPFVANDSPTDVEAIFPANRVSNSNPDGSGNQQNWAGKTFVYDGENRLYQANLSATSLYRYSYDGDGRRVKSQRFSVSGTTETALESTYYVYDANGQMIVETDGVTALGANPERKYLTADSLGSTRLMTKSSGTADTIVDSRFDYYPFGEEIARGTLGYGASAVRPKFTGQVRDGKTGLDYLGARYMAAGQGRFTSPDPYNILTESNSQEDFVSYLGNPQRWNRYQYGLNNPLLFVDPTGRTEISARQCQALGAECITVALNVIVDPNAGISQKQVDASIGALKSYYGDAKVFFEVSQVSGSFGADTAQGNAINVVFTNQSAGPEQAGMTDSGHAVLRLNPNHDAFRQSTPVHGMQHHILGHTTGWLDSLSNWSTKGCCGFLALGMNAFTDTAIDGNPFGLHIGGTYWMGATNWNSKTGIPSPRKDIQGGARMFSPGGSAYRRR